VIGYYGSVTWSAGALASGNLSEKPGRFLAGERRRMVVSSVSAPSTGGPDAAPSLPSPLRGGLVASKAGVSHGMSKADRALARRRQKIARELDEHRIETGEADEIAGR
jgi:hypothetical protein